MHLILFDIDGTLVDSTNFDGALFTKAVLDVLGIRVSSDWNRYRNVTDSGILNQIIDENGLESERDQIHESVSTRFAVLTARHLDQTPDAISEIIGSRAFLDSLRLKPDVLLGIATGGWRSTALMKLRAVGIETNGLGFASADDASSRIDIMKIAEAKVTDGIQPSRRTYFGDGPWDLQASRVLGFEFIGIGKNVEALARFDDYSDPTSILGVLLGPSN